MSITDVSDFDSDLWTRVAVAVALVNAFALDFAGGRALPTSPSDAELVRIAIATLHDAGAPHPVDVEQACLLRTLAHELRTIITALVASRFDDAQAQLNDLLRRSDARPHVHRSAAGVEWRLHFHRPDAGLAEGWGAGCGVGLAYVLSSRQTDRFGVCAADACERVFLDLTRNHSRRFCSSTCQNRVKAANHRRRRGRQP